MERIQIPARALVLVSDGRRARFLRNRGTPVRPELIMELSLGDENSPATAQATEHDAAEQADWRREAEQRFAGRVADTLYDMEHAHRFDELVVIAPPRMLGDLRAQMRAEVAETVVAELPRDLTSLAVPELGKMLS
jgi:protein required for attachment to host cells